MDGASCATGRKGCVTLRSVSIRLAVVLACALAACASPGMPPGGPVDVAAPQVVGISPDSGATGTKPPAVVFRFDEVVNERPSGVPTLNGLFLISPRDGEPRVDWNRSSISVRPRRGWRNNTAYTVTLLPGLSDLRGNTRNTGVVTLFSTGATIPGGRISGTVFSWTDGRALPRALVEARPRTDTTIVYVAAGDSIGNFSLTTMPPGAYLVRAIVDENNNKALDPREAWDSAAVTLTDTARTDMFAFVHDSIGTRIAGISVVDSVTLDVQFDNPIAPTSLPGPSNFRVRSSDSTDVPIVSVAPPATDTTIVNVRKMSRPIPPRSLIIKLARPLRPRTDYKITVTGVRNLTGVVKASDRTINVPAAPALIVAPPSGTPPVVPPSAPPVKR